MTSYSLFSFTFLGPTLTFDVDFVFTGARVLEDFNLNVEEAEGVFRRNGFYNKDVVAVDVHWHVTPVTDDA